MLMTPPYEQLHFDVLLRAGLPPIITVDEPGAHGAVAGMQGMGVSTPSAAAVAAATVGFAGLLHMPNVARLTIGAESIMVASAIMLPLTIFAGSTTNGHGAAPNVHIVCAPITTCCGIVRPFFYPKTCSSALVWITGCPVALRVPPVRRSAISLASSMWSCMTPTT